MNVQRHPVIGGLGGLCCGLGFAIMSLIYGLVRVEGLTVPVAIVGVSVVLGVALAMLWPASSVAAPPD